MNRGQIIVSPRIAEALSDFQKEYEKSFNGKSIKIEEWTTDALQKEYELINKKESNLSSNNRKKVIEILNLRINE